MFNSPKTLLKHLLYGSPDWPMDVNVQVFEVMFNFLIGTEGFHKTVNLLCILPTF